MMRRRFKRSQFKLRKRKKINCLDLLSPNLHRNLRKNQPQLLWSQNSHPNRFSQQLQNLSLKLILNQNQRQHLNLSLQCPNLNQPLSLNLPNKTILKLHLDSSLKSQKNLHQSLVHLNLNQKPFQSQKMKFQKSLSLHLLQRYLKIHQHLSQPQFLTLFHLV